MEVWIVGSHVRFIYISLLKLVPYLISYKEPSIISGIGAAIWLKTNFGQSQQNVTVVCRIECLACQDELFVNNPLDFKENFEHALDFTLLLSCRFSVSLSLDFLRMVPGFFPINLSNHCRGHRGDLHKILYWSFVGSTTKSLKARYMTSNKRT
jgi:hypothetical protein